MATIKDAFRPSITADEIFALLDIMDCARRGEQLAGLSPVLLDYYKKLRVQAFKIGEGIARPAYSTTGKKKESSISLEALGSSEAEVASWEGQYNNSAQMDDAVNDQLTWMINHPEIDTANMPAVQEFMKGGKYYAGSIGSDGSSSSNAMNTDCFITDAGEEVDNTFKLFNQL
jgi:hypothetical protein